MAKLKNMSIHFNTKCLLCAYRSCTEFTKSNVTKCKDTDICLHKDNICYTYTSFFLVLYSIKIKWATKPW